MKKCFLLLIVLSQIISCSPDSLENNYSSYDRGTELSEDDPTPEDGYLLKKVSHRKYGETDILDDTEFEYDNQERLIKSTSHGYSNGESEILSESNYEYNDQGRLSKITRHSNRANKIEGLTETEKLNLSGGITEFIYEEDVLTIKNEYNLNNELRRTTKILKVSDNEFHQNEYLPDGTLEITRIEYQGDGDCSLKRIEFHQDGEMIRHTEYEYLDANCSFRATAINHQYSQFSFEDTVTMDSKNSVIELVSRDLAGIISKDGSYKNEITYNAQDYPLHEIRTTQEGVKSETLYEYY